MTRLEALEAVAQAAAEYRRRRREDWPETQITVARSRLYDALDALPAAPTQAQGETVEVLMVEDKNNAEVRFFRVGSKGAQSYGEHWAYSNLGTTLLPIRATEGGGE
jgi:hypothetical protein